MWKKQKSLQCTKKPVCFSGKESKKRDYFDNLDDRNVHDPKTFWKTVELFFTDKGMNHDQIILVRGDEIISKNKQISEYLNNVFCWYYHKLEYCSAWRAD